MSATGWLALALGLEIVGAAVYAWAMTRGPRAQDDDVDRARFRHALSLTTRGITRG